ncbi:GNAT family N-acetyltransferase [Actinoplanes derwentensis]|uniref:Acetyltransferase (GNAT) family protein n=1 Tax=Actinoplanes derwentensis TaxID=113562 RepID=A0A1H1XMD9_9ACTN|nr:GNAT family N-acetyltransferase [Actinoplanes derwentensis]GID87719.1 hypothetical protein Ade03nite_66430 [Actinoplanes derwentensis]SDT10465.1 Acetyltransferase (GNAT) family protein [Actinoplanes derwentensis]
MIATMAAEIRPWRRADLSLLRAAAGSFSAQTLTARFLTGTCVLPTAYLHQLEQAEHLIEVAFVDGTPVGVAECVGCEIAVFVADEWQRRGIGTGLVRALLDRCAASGMTRVSALSAAGNTAVAALLGLDRGAAFQPGDWRLSSSAGQGVRQYVLER